MSSKEKDIFVDIVQEWLAEHCGKDSDAICRDEKGRVWIFVGGKKKYMPPQLAEIWKNL